MLLLAQAKTAKAADSLTKADQGIDTLTKLAKAGPTVLALAVALGAIVFAVYMMRQNWKLREEYAKDLKDRETEAKKESDDRLKEVLSAANERRATEKEMLREMVDRGHETAQALEGSSKAIEGFKGVLDTCIRRLDELDREQERRFAELLRKVEG